MKIQAVGDYITIEKLGKKDEEVGGIIIPGSQQSLLSKGKVLSVGNGKKIIKLDLKKGDLIYYNEVDSNCVSSDGTPTGAYFLRHDFIFGRETN